MLSEEPTVRDIYVPEGDSLPYDVATDDCMEFNFFAIILDQAVGLAGLLPMGGRAKRAASGEAVAGHYGCLLG